MLNSTVKFRGRIGSRLESLEPRLLLAADAIVGSDTSNSSDPCCGAEQLQPFHLEAANENLGAGAAGGHAEGSEIRINEILATNASSLTTRVRSSLGEPLGRNVLTPDWVEIANHSDQPMDLAGYHLSDDQDVLTKWTFPSGTIIPANNYLVVFASGLNITDSRLDDRARLHTNFKLDSDGGDFLAISYPDGSLADIFANEIPEQYADVAYGLHSGQLEYLIAPTPGAENASAYAGVVAEVTFSVPRGFYDRSFQLFLTTSTANAEIRFTTDGSEPSANNGQKYVNGVQVTRTTNLRAAAFRDGFLPSQVTTHSYVYLQHVLQQAARIEGFPSGGQVWAGRDTFVPQDTEMDPDIVNDPAYAIDIQNGLKAIPTISITSDPNAIFGDSGWYDGENVESPISVEVLHFGDQRRNHQANAGIESHSHDRLKRSLRLNFRGTYGDDIFETDLFQSAPLNGDTAADGVKRIVLRGGNNRSWARIWNPDKTAYTIDEFYRATQIAMSGYGLRGNFSHLYINGVYWGLYNPVERADEFYWSSYFGGDTHDWFAVNHRGDLTESDDRFDYLIRNLTTVDLRRDHNYRELRSYLDVENFADYLIGSWWMAVSDWPQNNWYGGNRSETSSLGAEPFRFAAWDGEWSFGQGAQSSPDGQAHVHASFRSSQTSDEPIARLWHALRRNSDFMTMFSDRVYKHLFHDGALTEENARERWLTLNAYVGDAVIAESARWGDSLRSIGQPTRTRDVDWRREVDRVNDLITGNTQAMVEALRREGYFPSLNPPILSRQGGRFSSPFQLTFFNPGSKGSIYTTADGSDPRLPGGGVSPVAAIIQSGATLPLERDVLLKARVFDGQEWSPLTEAAFLGGDETSLRITEIMYNPPAPTDFEIAAGFVDSDDFEFVEIQNVGHTIVQMQDYRIADGIELTFPTMQLRPQEFAVVAKNTNAFVTRYGSKPENFAGQFKGRLDNSGDRLTLVDPLGRSTINFRYDDSRHWPAQADGVGSSLQLADPFVSSISYLDRPHHWSGSVEYGGSPGQPGQNSIGIVINEILANTDGTSFSDSIELQNVSEQPIDLSGWFFSDSETNLFKYAIPNGTILDPHEFVVFDETNFNRPASPSGFALSGSRGDNVWLVVPSGRDDVHAFVDHVRFDATRIGESIGRVPESKERLVPLTTVTLGGRNARARVGPVVISEINYTTVEPSAAALAIDPTISRNDLEFVELQNGSSAPIDISNWSIKGDIDFRIPENTVVSSGESVLVTSFAPHDSRNSNRLRAFRRHYSLTDSTSILGGYFGRLQERGGIIRLLRPEVGDAENGSPMFSTVEDEVLYETEHPWPALSNQIAQSLQRKTASAYGGAAATWRTIRPSPGRSNFIASTPGDFDGNGTVEAHDIDLLCTSAMGSFESLFDLNADGRVDADDLSRMLNDLLRTTPGDANLDGVFDSGDFIQVFIAGEFEDSIAGNSGWSDGDWNCDGDFTTRDLIVAFQVGDFARNATLDFDLIAAAMWQYPSARVGSRALIM